MNKKGELFVGAIIMLVITAIGAYTVYDASNNLYVGNSGTHHYLNYFKCKDAAHKIPADKLIIFKSSEEPINKGYNETEGCV